MEDEADGVTATVRRFRAARSAPPAVETEAALARLESVLFAIPRDEPLLDRYTIVRRLGEGTSGVVYLAFDPALDRNVAIKLLHAGATGIDGHTEGRARLLREAQAIARSPHPNVVAVYDVGTYGTASGESGLFIVMEYVEGPSLQAWLAATHAWREVVDVFVAAGQGLAAAHRVGVTHRDFKPANVIVAPDGRARVLDFGLARGLERDEEDTLPVDGSGDANLALDGALTAEGTVLGTPAFMAPEQHAGRPADPASDQYSFCVALWQGLYGGRPFAGRSLEELAKSKQAGPPPIPASDGVSMRIGSVLARGLAVDPLARWASMEALLVALERATSARRSRRGVWVASAVVASLAIAGIVFASDDRSCTGADHRFAATWNAERRASIASAFADAELPYAAASLDRVAQRVDAFGRVWSQHRRDACEAGRDELPQVLDLRMACLDDQLDEVDALLAVFERADARTVERSIEAASGLPVPSACEDAAALLAEVPPPSDADLAAAVERERSDLARVRALEQAGRIAEAHDLARAVTDRAETLGYAPLLAEALYLRGALEDDEGRYDEATASVERAHSLALESGHDRQAASASTQLVYLEGYRLRRTDAALAWAHTAEAELDRAGVRDRSPLAMALASALHVAERYADAAAKIEEAIGMIEDMGGPDDVRLATAHNNLGETLRQSGQLDRARTELELALAIYERSHGEGHPRAALAVNNLASIDLQTGDLARAEQGFRRVIEIRERLLGPDHPDVATALANLGLALRDQGRLDEARDVYTHALAMLEPRGPEETRTAGVLLGLARIEQERGDLEAARREVDRALALQEDALPPEHLDIARSLQIRALVLAELGDIQAARSSFDRGEAIKARAVGLDDGWIADGRLAFAKALDARGEERDAVRLVERALEDLAGDADPEQRRVLEAWLAERGGRYALSDAPTRPAGL